MTPREAIEQAFTEVVSSLEETKARYLQDLIDNPADFENVTSEDATIWFIESF